MEKANCDRIRVALDQVEEIIMQERATPDGLMSLARLLRSVGEVRQRVEWLEKESGDFWRNRGKDTAKSE